MKRHNVKELENLLANTTPGEWNEDRILTVFRSSSIVRHKSVLMAQVKDESGVARSEHVRPNGVLMSMARNFAEELLDLKRHTYGQEDCSGCADRDGQIETAQEAAATWMRRADSFEAENGKLKERVAWMESLSNFEAKRLKRLATICGYAYGNESDEFVLGAAGSILGQICFTVEGMLKTSELKCKDCQHINFHDQCHEVQQKTAERCMAVVSVFYDGHHPLGIQSRIALKIKEEFGVEDGVPCPLCQSADTVKTASANGVQIDGQETGVTTHLCVACRNEWSD